MQYFANHDAYAGALHDLPNWTRAKFTQVITVEKDNRRYREGLLTAQYKEWHFAKGLMCAGRFILSIDVSHNESIITRSELQKRFEDSGRSSEVAI